MNELSIITTSAMQGFMQLRETNRLKYPLAYYDAETRKSFSLGSYLSKYCMNSSEWKNDSPPEWIFSFVDRGCALTPEISRQHYGASYCGFFGLPRQVQEGILIYIHEELYNNPGELGDFLPINDDFMVDAAADIIRQVTMHSEAFAELKNEEQMDQMLDDDVEAWYQGFDSFNGGGWLPFFDSDEEIILFCQLVACMGGEICLYPPSLYDYELAPADVLLEGVAAWEKLKGVKMPLDGREFENTDTVIAINASQSVVTGNTYLADYMEEIFNQSPWRIWLKELMEDFREYFPLRKEKIRVDAYAQIANRGHR